MKPKHQRLMWIGVAAALLGVAVMLVVEAFDDTLVFFYSPTDLKSKALKPNQRVRVGGLVREGSLQQEAEGVRFVITDEAQDVTVVYKGLLPDLFREGQGVVVEGRFDKERRVFQAQSVLAKHDENYMPPEVAKALKEQGVWRHAE